MKKNLMLAVALGSCVFTSDEVLGETVQSDINNPNTTKAFTLSNSSNSNEAMVKKDLRNFAFCLSDNKYNNKEILWSEVLEMPEDFDPLELRQDTFVRINNDMEIKQGETLAAHSANLFNNFPLEQTMYTAAFEYTQTDSVSTKTSHTAGVETSATVEMKFPLLSGSTSLTTKYEFNRTEDVVSTIEKKWAINAVPVRVLAGRQYMVNWVLTTGVATGTTTLISKVNANIPYKKKGNTRYSLPLGEALTIEKELQRGTATGITTLWGALDQWERDGSGGVRTWADATYTAKYGASLSMDIVDVTNVQKDKKGRMLSNPVLVKNIPLDIVPEIVD